jgi:sulfotransferase family protein
MTKFVILTLPRTGSTLLSKSLNKHPEIFCDDEIFHFSFRNYFSPDQFHFLKIRFLSKKLNYIINYPFIYLRLNRFLKKYFTNKRGENFKARGFKLMYYQTLYMPGLIDYLKRNNIKIILLLRKNIFRNALSDMRARKTGVYHRKENEKAVSGLPKLNVDVTVLKNKMNQIIHQNKKLVRITENMNYMKIWYEDFADWNNTMNKIFDFLDVSQSDVSAAAKKLNPDSAGDMIANFNEVKNWLQQNNYSEFLN